MSRVLLLSTCLSVLVLGCGAPQDDPPASDPGETSAAQGGDAGHACVTVNESDFQQVVLQSPQPVLVDLWASWCGPCVELAPTIEQLAVEYQGRVVVAKVNVDENENLADQYVDEGIPTLLFFNNGELVGTLVGARPKSQIAARLDALLADS